MRRIHPLLLLAAVVFAVVLWQRRTPSPVTVAPSATTLQTASEGAARPRPGSFDAVLPSFLPAEARTTLATIAHGGPFEHRQDGVVFGNYEGLLPPQPRGYYHEYTVETPGADTRGARRIITGGTPPTVYYYTDDHYRSFHPFEVAR